MKDDDFSAERFEYVEKLERDCSQYNDDLVNSSFISFSDFDLWNAVFRVWGAFITPGVHAPDPRPDAVPARPATTPTSRNWRTPSTPVCGGRRAPR